MNFQKLKLFLAHPVHKVKIHIPSEPKKLHAWRDVCGIKSMQSIFTIKVLIYQSKDNLDVTFCLAKSLIIRTQKLEKCL